MTGQRDRDTGGAGRRSRVDRSLPRHVAVFEDASGSAIDVSLPIPIGTATEPIRSLDLATQTTYRRLMLRGLASEQAANLTAFLCGIPIADQRWGLLEVNRLLFLRQLSRAGRIGGAGDLRTDDQGLDNRIID